MVSETLAPPIGLRDDPVDVRDGETVPSRLFALHVEVYVEAAGRSLSERAPRPRDFRDGAFHGDGGLLDRVQIVAEDLDSERAPDSRCEHFRARLDGHPPDVGHAGKVKLF